VTPAQHAAQTTVSAAVHIFTRELLTQQKRCPHRFALCQYHLSPLSSYDLFLLPPILPPTRHHFCRATCRTFRFRDVLDLIIFGVPSGVKDYVTKPHYSDCPIISIAWSPDNARVISGSRDGTICVQEARSGKSILFVMGSMNDNIVSVAFSPDSSRCLSASIRGFMRLWDIASRTIVSSFPNKEHNTLCVSLSIDSKQILCGSRDGKIRIWDSGSTANHGGIGSHEGKRRKGHVSTVHKVLFSPNGEYAVSGSEDCTIRIWSVESGEELSSPLRGHWSSVVTMIFFPDGSHLVSGSLDKNIHVWDITSQGAPLLVLRGTKITFCAFAVDVSPDGSKIISSSRDRNIRIWDTRSGEALSVITDNGGVPAFSVSFPMQAVMCACEMQIILHSFCKPPHSTTRPPSFRLPSHRTANELFVPQPLKYLCWMPLPVNVYPPSRIRRNPFVPSLIPCFMMPSVSIDSDLLWTFGLAERYPGYLPFFLQVPSPHQHPQPTRSCSALIRAEFLSYIFPLSYSQALRLKHLLRKTTVICPTTFSLNYTIHLMGLYHVGMCHRYPSVHLD
jgi:hypothetical protein